MEKYKLGEMEKRFADLIWECQPVSSGDLVKLCEREFLWKKSTTYTMLKRLCNREIFRNENGTVHALIEKSDYHAIQGEAFINETFSGSLPQFLVAFTKRKKLSSLEVSELQRLIDEYKED